MPPRLPLNLLLQRGLTHAPGILRGIGGVDLRQELGPQIFNRKGSANRNPRKLLQHRSREADEQAIRGRRWADEGESGGEQSEEKAAVKEHMDLSSKKLPNISP